MHILHHLLFSSRFVEIVKTLLQMKVLQKALLTV